MFLVQEPIARYLAEEVSKTAHTAIICPDERKIPGVKTYYLKLPFKVAFTGHPEWKNCKLYKNIDTFELLRIYKAFLNASVEAVADFKPNIIHVHHAFPFSWAARFIKSTYQLPYIITVHGSKLHTAILQKKTSAILHLPLMHCAKPDALSQTLFTPKIGC